MSREELLKILLDKGLLALLALVFGFFLSRALERYKRGQAILQALATKRADALVEVLSQALIIDVSVEKLLTMDKAREETLVADLVTQITEDVLQLNSLLRSNRFLIGAYCEICYWYIQMQNLRAQHWARGDAQEVEKAGKVLTKLNRQMEGMLAKGPDARVTFRVRWLLFVLRGAYSEAKRSKP